MGKLSACDRPALLSPLIIQKSRTVSEVQMIRSFDFLQLLVIQAVNNSGIIQEFVFRIRVWTRIKICCVGTVVQ